MLQIWRTNVFVSPGALRSDGHTTMGPRRTSVDGWSYGDVYHLIVEHLVELRSANAGSRNLYQR